jgi:hypothetical protein
MPDRAHPAPAVRHGRFLYSKAKDCARYPLKTAEDVAEMLRLKGCGWGRKACTGGLCSVMFSRRTPMATSF